MIALVAFLAAAAADAAVVARVGSTPVDKRLIQCNRVQVAADTRKTGADLDHLCRTLEQEALNRIVLQRILDRAAASYPIEPTSAALDERLPKDDVLELLAARTAAMARAALRLKHGEPIDVVLRSTAGLEQTSEADLRLFSGRFKSDAEITYYLTTCTAAQLRSQMRKNARYQLLELNLRSYVRDAARRAGRQVSEESQIVWHTLIDGQDGAVILDPSYTLISWKEVLPQ